MRRALAALAVSCLSARARGQVLDTVTVGVVHVSGGTGIVRVPVFLHDVAGTPIGWDRGPHEHIDDLAIVVSYGPNPCLDSVSPFFDPSQGVTAGLEGPSVVQLRPRNAGVSQGFVFSMAEADGLIPFTDSAAPGDLVGDVVLGMSGCGAEPIRLDVTIAAASSDGNVVEELAVVPGWILREGMDVPTATPTPTRTPPPPTPTVTPTRDPSAPTPTPIVGGGGGGGGGGGSSAAAAIPAAGGPGLALLGVAIAAAGLVLARRLAR